MADVELVRLGWHLSASGYRTCSDEGKKSVQETIKVALDLDLRETGEKSLPEGINKGRIDSVSGPCVLQIQKLRNVAAPKDNEESNTAPKLFKLSLTDGQSNCNAVLTDPVDSLNLNTSPGTKIKLLGLIDVKHGFLLLSNTNTKVLGGQVEQMHHNWELKRSLAKHTRVAVATVEEGGPPPFIPLGKRDRNDRTTVNRRDGFKSLDLNKEEKKKEENEEFAMQRQATIAEALRGKEGRKTFGGGQKKPQDKDVAKLVEMGFAAEKASSALRQSSGNVAEAINVLTTGRMEYPDSRDSRPSVMRGPSRVGSRAEKDERPGFDRDRDRDERPRGRGRGRGRDDDEEGYGAPPSKPSAPATLFDFLETKITTKDDTKGAKASASQSQGKTTSSSEYASSRSSQYTANSNSGQTFFQKRMENLPPRFQKQQQKGQYADSYNDSQYSNRSNQGNRGRPNYESHEDSYRGRGRDSRNNDTDYGKQGRNDRMKPGAASASSRDYAGGNRRPNQSAENSQRSNYDSERQNRNRGERFQDNRGQDYRGQGHRSDRSKGQDYDSRSRDQGSRGQYYNNRSGNDARHSGNGDGYRGQEYNRGGRQHSQNYNNRSKDSESNDRSQPQNYKSQDYQNKSQPKEQGRRSQEQSYDDKSMTYDQNGQTNYYEQETSTSAAPQAIPVQSLEQAVTYSTSNGADTRLAEYSTYVPQSNHYNGQYNQGWEDGASQMNHNHVQHVEYYQDHSQPYPRKWKVGDYCLAQYWEDKEFYRATIVGVSDNVETCVVTFTDYGNTEEVLLAEIKMIPKALLAELTSQQAVQYPPQPQYVQQMPLSFKAIDFSVPPPPLPAEMYTNQMQGPVEYRRGGQGHQYQQGYQKTT
ncbi:tudor domain-containing protein 3-like isoform X2 [Lineus longissimus]|uniref:tudor domain-containing protein 3-like isoform X2 n=1 Tax=Lineus longissimus TaxID=88925 RepID=UPI00315D99DC